MNSKEAAYASSTTITTQKLRALYYTATAPLSHHGCHAGITDGRKMWVIHSGVMVISN
jgi:hypothetical protein